MVAPVPHREATSRPRPLRSRTVGGHHVTRWAAIANEVVQLAIAPSVLGAVGVADRVPPHLEAHRYIGIGMPPVSSATSAVTAASASSGPPGRRRFAAIAT